MPAPDLIQQQREILRQVNKTKQQRAQTQTAAEEHLRSEIEAARKTLDETLKKIAEQMDEVYKFLEKRRWFKNWFTDLRRAHFLMRPWATSSGARERRLPRKLST